MYVCMYVYVCMCVIVCVCAELTDDEDDDSSPVDDDVMGGAEGFKGQHLSFLSLSLRVDEAVLSMFPEVSYLWICPDCNGVDSLASGC